MTSDAPEDPPKPAYKEILEEERNRKNHVVDVLPKCRHIMDITLDEYKETRLT